MLRSPRKCICGVDVQVVVFTDDGSHLSSAIASHRCSHFWIGSHDSIQTATAVRFGIVETVFGVDGVAIGRDNPVGIRNRLQGSSATNAVETVLRDQRRHRLLA